MMPMGGSQQLLCEMDGLEGHVSFESDESRFNFTRRSGWMHIDGSQGGSNEMSSFLLADNCWVKSSSKRIWKR